MYVQGFLPLKDFGGYANYTLKHNHSYLFTYQISYLPSPDGEPKALHQRGHISHIIQQKLINNTQYIEHTYITMIKTNNIKSQPKITFLKSKTPV